MTQRSYEYDNSTSETANRRLLSEITFHQAPAANGVCSGCKYHQVSSSPAGSTAWESNGRHYSTQSHSGNLGNDTRTVTTTWTPTNWMTPNGQTVLPSLYNHRLESDSSSSVDRYFEFNGSNGFLNCSFLHDAARQRVFFNRRYPNGDGTLSLDFTASAEPFPDPPYIGQCTAAYPSAPAVGTNGDAFGKVYTYQNGLLNTVRWINGNAPASWYSNNYTRDPGTGWITASSDTAGLTTTYQYDSLGRVTLITPPGGEASTVVGYPSTTRTTATRNGGAGLSNYQQYEYDGLGRPSREIHQMPGFNHYAVRTHAYDAPGHRFFDSNSPELHSAALRSPELAQPRCAGGRVIESPARKLIGAQPSVVTRDGIRPVHEIGAVVLRAVGHRRVHARAPERVLSAAADVSLDDYAVRGHV